MAKAEGRSLSLTLFHVFYSTILGEKAVQNLRVREEMEEEREEMEEEKEEKEERVQSGRGGRRHTHTVKHTRTH